MVEAEAGVSRRRTRKEHAMSIVRLDLNSDIDDLRREVSQLLTTMPAMPLMFGGDGGSDRFLPAMDTVERDGAIIVTIDLPGMRREDIDIEVQDDVLRIRGSREIQRDSEEETWYRYERSSGSFERYLRLPQSIDAESIDAVFDQGVLTVTVPLPAIADASPRKISVTTRA
jgi:HSP20 family protein